MNRRRLTWFLVAVMFGVHLWWLNRVSQPGRMVVSDNLPRWMSDRTGRMAVRDPKHSSGVICLSVVSSLLGQPVTLGRSSEVLSPATDGILSMADLTDGCRSLGFESAAATVDPDRVPSDCLCIAHVNGDHFVVLRHESDRTWAVIDVPDGTYLVSEADLRKHLDGSEFFVAHSAVELEFLTRSQ